MPDLTGRETALPGQVVTALPFDRDSILATLEHRAPGPRPHTRVLDSLFQAFRVPFLEFAKVAWDSERIRRQRDSLARHAGSVRDTAARAALARQVRAADDSLRGLESALGRRRTALSAARDTLWPRIERLRAEVQQWELTTFAGYDSILRSLRRERFRQPIIDTTDARGWVSLVLPAGRWWLAASAPDPADPNAQWRWNLLAAGDTMRLTTTNARHLPRY